MRWQTTNYLLAVLFITFLSAACQQPAADKKSMPVTTKDKMYVEVKTFETTNGWGYEVYADGKLYIQQPFIPGIAGTHGFLSQQDALKAGNLILTKMRRQERFPVITKPELLALGIALPQ